MARVFIPAQMRDICGGLSLVEVTPDKVRQVLLELDRRYPGFLERILDRDGNLEPYLTLLIDGEDADLHGGMLALVGPGSEVHIILAMSGGTGWNKGQGKGGRILGGWG